jgi:Na+(H+)/acetate symporter ActP
VPYLLSLPSEHLGLAAIVGLAFAVAAATFCPLLVLGIWWRGLTAPGALVGVLVGGVASAGAVAVSLAGLGGSGWVGVLLYRPAIVTVPAAFVAMIVVSRLTASKRPADAAQVLLRLHAPERLGLSRDRLDERVQRPAR